MDYVFEPAVARNMANVSGALLLDCSAAFDDTSNIVLAAHSSTMVDLHLSDKAIGTKDERSTGLRVERT